ncbi:8268_t:CDS:2 [Ambispora leptoticha]|uniref:8268_t:CDS:1 n=1 Tax=Ambispora leptoticha TaxID=144679 RepID=A0A9N9BJG5_9GLOM|nr:8268_t:CDS:2 [Ambispora leptoticha]
MQDPRRYIAAQSHSSDTSGYLSFSIGASIEVSGDHYADRLWGKLNDGVEGWIAQDTFKNCLFSADFLDDLDLSMESQDSTENVSNDSNTSTLVFNGLQLAFPQNDKSDFLQLRMDPDLAYFDRTGYISVLSSFKENGLAVDQDVQAGTVMHNQYLVLSFDFSKIDRDSDPKVAKAGLFEMINKAIGLFYAKYAVYLNEAIKLSQMFTDQPLINQNNAISSLDQCVNVVQLALQTAEGVVNHPLAGMKGIYLLADEYDAFANEYLNLQDATSYDSIHRGQSSLKDFWACVKSSMGYQRIEKCFITGVLPFSMTDATSGFNIATNISDEEDLAGFCGLSYGDVRFALKAFCKNGDIEKYFRIMVRHYNGYGFSPYSAWRVFNTNTCLEYLQSLLRNKPINPSNPSNWETSETLLQILAKSPIATSILEKASSRDSALDFDVWREPIPHGMLPSEFRFSDLNFYDATRRLTKMSAIKSK